jgi:hypothetical protein
VALTSARESIQPKLTLGARHDAHEQEASRVAASVMRMPEPGPETVQRACPECEQEKREHGGRMPEIRRQKASSDAPDINSDTESEINRMRGGGQPLAASVRRFMEPRFGEDFSGVRVHTGAEAVRTAQALNARAYTVGRDVVFAAGQYAPDTAEGKQLLAHELTHVVQQGFGRQQGGLQRDDKPSVPAGKPGSSPDVDATVKNIESIWKGVAAVAASYPELKQWIVQGDTVVALIQTHVKAALNAISANNGILSAAYMQVLESDKITYDFISWHVVAYANLLSLRSGIDGLINAFDHDSDVGFGFHYFRKFTGRANAERIARGLKKAIDGVPADSAKLSGLVRTDVPLTVQSISQPITVTGAAIPAARATIEKQTRAMETLQLNIQRGVDYENQFLDGAFKEGGQQAIDNVKEYYKLKKSIEKKDPKEKTGEAPEPQPVPVTSPSPDEEEKKKRRGTMRHQIQQARDFHYSSLAVTALDDNGVTGLQLRATMAANFDQYMSIARGEQPVPRGWTKGPVQWEKPIRAGIIAQSQAIPDIVAGGGVIVGGNVRALQRCFDPNTGSPSGCATNDVRLDVENTGHNLKRE